MSEYFENEYSIDYDRYLTFQQEIGYMFSNLSLLIQACTHTTFAYEAIKDPVPDNQRLEFLGDSILGMVIAEYLFCHDPQASEGTMTQQRAELVNKRHLASCARKIGLNQYLLLGKGEEKLDGRNNDSNLSGALEAVIGAIYLDGGLAAASQFIVRIIA